MQSSGNSLAAERRGGYSDVGGADRRITIGELIVFHSGQQDSVTAILMFYSANYELRGFYGP